MVNEDVLLARKRRKKKKERNPFFSLVRLKKGICEQKKIK
jgi:hypothetical protein